MNERRFGAILRKPEGGSWKYVSAYAVDIPGMEREVHDRYLTRPDFEGYTIEALTWCDYLDVMSPEWAALCP